MRLLHVVASYRPAVRYGGTIVSVHALCKALAARGHDVEVMTTSVDGPGDSPVPHGVPVDLDGVRVWYFRSRFVRRIYYAPKLAAALASRIHEFDVVHTHAVFLWPLWAAARQARASGVPYLMSPRGMLEKALIARKNRTFKSAWIRFVERRNLEQASAIHVTSAREAAELEAFHFRLPPIVTIANGVEPAGREVLAAPVAEPIAATIRQGPYVLFLGRVSWKKGIDRLVRSMPYMPAPLRVVVAGIDDEGLRVSLEADAARLGLADRLVFTGPVAGAGKQALLANAQLLVLPSYSENFGNVVLEAMAAGCPVIVTPEVGAAPIVAAAGAGWVVSGEPSILGSRISSLAANAELRAGMSARAREAARDYTWDSVAGQMESVYGGLLR